MRHADILNKLDEIIYVVDMESYELLYLNRAARSLCAGERETLGRKCYKVLQGRDEPCHFCPVDNLRDDVFHCWEYANLKLAAISLFETKLCPGAVGRRGWRWPSTSRGSSGRKSVWNDG